MRLIDAEAFRKALLIGASYLDEDTLMTVVNVLDCAPTIDPASLRPKGEWSKTECKPYWHIKCSLCGYRVFFEDRTNFCPNCGADMRGDPNDS